MNTPTQPPAAGEAARTPTLSKTTPVKNNAGVYVSQVVDGYYPFATVSGITAEECDVKADRIMISCNQHATLKAKADRCAELEKALERAASQLETASRRITDYDKLAMGQLVLGWAHEARTTLNAPPPSL